MPYVPQRRHAVSTISSAVHALNLMEHLYQPNLLILVARILGQMQITAAGVIHPNRTLLSLCLLLLLLNATAGLLHFLDHLGGGGKGIMLDFVGQVRQPSLTRMLLLDLIIFLLQLHSLTISYLTNKPIGTFNPVPSLPYTDMLLPVPEVEEVGPEDFDVESGLRRRKGKGRAAMDDEEDEEVVWLDEAEEPEAVRPSERDRLLAQTTPAHQRTREPPRVISLSVSHLLNLILHMSHPATIPRVFSGTTPAVSPPDSPVGGTTLFSNPYETEHDEVSGQNEEVSSRRGTNRPSGTDDDEEARRDEEDRGGRIPGDYWVRGRGDG